MKADERQFLERLQELSRGDRPPMPRQVAHELGIHEKRAHRICEKWDRKGWLDYGVAPLAGWLTDEGMQAG